MGGSVLAFFSRLEMFCMRIGVAWILRDPIIILIILLVLVVQPVLAGALTDAPSRFLALLYFFRPSLIVSLNSLVYGLEGERPPDAAPSKAAEVEDKREQKKEKASGGGFSALKGLGSVLAFFSRLEMFCMRQSLCGEHADEGRRSSRRR